jgi:hypothetical protein
MSKIPDSKVAKRYDVCSKTLQRWDGKPELGFPAAEWINGRKYRDSDKLDAWDQANANAGPAEHRLRGVAATAKALKDKASAASGTASTSEAA